MSAAATAAVPRVSVVMTAWNGSAWIGETIESVLAQTLRDFELVIVDDASTDDTCAVIERFDDPRIRLVRNTRNLGISPTRNRALALARAPYVAATDQDDLSEPTRLERQVAYLEANPGVVLAATAARELRDGRTRLRYLGELDSALLHWRLFSRCDIVHSSICFRRAALEAHGLSYDADYPCSEDYLLFHRFAAIGDIVVLNEPLVTYREHAQAASARHSETMNLNAARLLARRYREYLGIEVDLDEARLLVRVFLLGAPVAEEADIVRAGELFARGLAAFLDRRMPDTATVQRLRRWSARRWWEALAGQSNAQRRYELMELFARVAAFRDVPLEVGLLARAKLAARGAMAGLSPARRRGGERAGPSAGG